jgi:hypothetical protein
VRRLVPLLLVLLIGCASTDAATPDHEIAAAIARDRLYDVTRTFELTFVNGSDEAAVIGGAELRTGLFEPLGLDDRDTAIGPDRTVSRPVEYGEARCGDDVDDAMTLGVVIDGVETELDLGRASPAMLRLHAERCAAQEIEAAVDVHFGDDWTSKEPTRATGTLMVDPKDGADVTLESVATQIVFVTTVDDPLPARDDVKLVATAARCDAHALTESKKTFLYVLTFRIDGGEPVKLELRATDGPVLDAMRTAIDECVAARTDGR